MGNLQPVIAHGANLAHASNSAACAGRTSQRRRGAAPGAAPAGAAPNQTSSPNQPPAPTFDQRPGAELKGLTTVGILVETLSAQATACGLNQDAIEGALSKRRKQELVSEATKAVSAAAGLGEADGLRVWVLINEVPEGNWGAAGNVVEFEQLRKAAARERETANGAAVSAS